MSGKANQLSAQLARMAAQFQTLSNQYATDQTENLKKFDMLTKNSSMLNQKNYEKDIVLSGLPAGFDEKLIADNFMKYFNLNQLNVNYFFKFFKTDNDGKIFFLGYTNCLNLDVLFYDFKAIRKN